MLPIERVFADILLAVGGNEIKIPSQREIRILSRKPTLGPLSRSSTAYQRVTASTDTKQSSGNMTKMHVSDQQTQTPQRECVYSKSSPNGSWCKTKPTDQNNLHYTSSTSNSASLAPFSQMDYARRLNAYVNSSTSHHIYPGVQYKELGKYLLGNYD